MPLDLEALVKSGFGAFASSEPDFNQQATMLTPIGGMDRIAVAFAERVIAGGGGVRYRAMVKEVRRTVGGATSVRVVYADAKEGGAAREVVGDFCVCALPPPLLARCAADFSTPVKRAIGSVKPAPAGKIGLQFRRRSWEEDENIYGGVSRTDQPIRQIIYPSEGFGQKKSVLLGYYHFGEGWLTFDDVTFGERERRALEQGANLHPQYRTDFENSFSVGWSYVPHSEMAWAEWRSGEEFENCLKVLGVGESRFYFAGDWLSYLNSWQAGAFVSAQRVCRELHQRAQVSRQRDG